MVTFYRRLPKFDYLSPRNIEEALDFLARFRDKAVLLAGGTDLIPKLKRRVMPAPQYLIDLKSLPGLNYIKYENGDGLRIGPLVTIDDVEKSVYIKEKYQLLVRAAETMASPQVRHRGTIAGNICNAVPSVDTAPALLVMDAKVRLISKESDRTIGMAEFFKGPGETVLKQDEMLTEIQIPDLPANSMCKYIKLSVRRAMDLAIAGVAVLLVPDGNRCGEVRIALGAVSPTPVRAVTAETLLRGQEPDTGLIERVAVAAAADCHPISDYRASAEYRTEMVSVLTKRAIKELWQMR